MFSVQCLQLGLPGYLIRFAPPAFVPDRQTRSSKVPSPLVVQLGLQHFTTSLIIPFASSDL